MASTLELLESADLVQTIDGDEQVRLHKEVWRLPGEAPLYLVRKHLPGGPRRPPLLLVHGFAQNRYSWHTSRRSPSAFWASRGFDVWNLELRGHGRGREAGVEGARAFSDYIEDVARAAQALPGRAFWIGHSLGGAALYGAAARLGSSSTARPLGVIGIGAIYTFAQANPFLKLLSSLSLAASRQRWFSRFQVRTQLAGQLIARLYSISDVAGFAFPVSGWWPGSIEPELLEERLQKGFDWTSVQVWLEMSRWATTGEVDFDEQWRRTDLPLLVILGDKDHLAPPGDGRVAFDRSGSSDRSLLLLDDWHHETHWGHLDIVLGRLARRHVWEPIDRWMAERLPAPRR